jgi:hypothetical protein
MPNPDGTPNGVPLMLLLTPCIYMLTCCYFLCDSLHTFIEYEVMLLRFMIAGWFMFCLSYVTLIPLFFLMPPTDDMAYKALFFTTIPTITGVIFWYRLIDIGPPQFELCLKPVFGLFPTCELSDATPVLECIAGHLYAPTLSAIE